MKTLDQITQALGHPQAIRTFQSGSRVVAAVARWRHRGAFVDLSRTDSYQVIFNISGGQIVEFQTPQDSVLRRTVRAGSIGLNVPEQPSKLNISGESDTLQILLTREWIESVSGSATTIALPQLSLCESQLQAASAQALVALERRGANGSKELDVIMRFIANRFTEPATIPMEPSHGGLSPSARRRVWALIEERLNSRRPSLSLEELASAAGLTVHHFIKAFRRTEGQTPHARLITCRLDHALDMLLQANIQVDLISDLMGFSSPSHFISVFRKHLGVTPGILRDAAHMRH